MSHFSRPQAFRWEWSLRASPEALWPWVSNTDRFNRDCGFPPVVPVPLEEIGGAAPADARRLRTRRYGWVLEWDERAFEWIRLHRFGVERIFQRGPFAAIRAHCELTPQGEGTLLTYRIWFTPANLLGRLALLLGAHRLQFKAPFARVFADYDRRALAGEQPGSTDSKPQLASGGRRRLADIARRLVEQGQPAAAVDLLTGFIATADDLSLTRIRPYVLADLWQIDRRQMLRLFLQASRAGLLDFTWDILCPLCRGPKSRVPALAELTTGMHCEACQIDFTVNFEQSVELTFQPSPGLRRITAVDYCVGGPQVTPHIMVQQKLAPGEQAVVPLELPAGRYRLRSLPAVPPRFLRVEPGGAGEILCVLGPEAEDDHALAPVSRIAIRNDTAEPLRAILESLSWTDQAATAREVTALQTFRDLYSNEVLRPGEQISLGSVTLLFTDLKGSTQMYERIGDAPAFGQVLSHFATLRACVDAEGGAWVKTMGDAIMAVFPQPLPALRAALAAQRQLALLDGSGGAPLALKAGLHHGPCLMINQNDRLDYFGSTVNLACRLSDLSSGADIVASAEVSADPEVAAYLSEPGVKIAAVEHVAVRGFETAPIELWRICAT